MSQTDDGLEDLPSDEEYEEEEEEEEEEVEEEEERWTIYNSDSFISGPAQSTKCTIKEEVLKFHFSFGYNCRKYFNLTSPDPDTLIFASGNFINFFDVESKAISFRRSALGGGIGHIKANPHPDFNHVAVAENGHVPLIIIYEWPTMDIVSVLKGGSSKLYSHLDYSPDGKLLLSQGGDPDYLITVWNWPKRRILLRTKSYVNDVFRIKFSPYCPGHLTTSGISHIKFWKMARTFTGLKLQGELGRFGKTEFSDILGVLPMPDEKVVSGCSWGNILVWDAGLIKLEVFRTLRRKCHEGPIVQISFHEGELMTVAMDGHVKVWWYEKIDQADPPDEDRIIQIEPTYDFYTPGLMLMCIRKRYMDPKDSTYFGQDGNGGIWIIDLNTEEPPKESIQLYKCHAGKIVAIAACPWGPYLVSLGEDGRVYVYAYLRKKRIFEHQYPAHGISLIWLSSKIVPSGDELLMGFDDGTIRLSILSIEKDESVNLQVVQIIKSHEKPITQISVNPSNTILVSGSEDSTIFFFQINTENGTELVPIGYIRVPNPVTCFTWHYKNPDLVIIGCLHGEILQVEAPREPQPYTTVSYLLDLSLEENKFKTYKSQIRRNIKIKEIEARKAKKVEKKRVEMEKLKKENPGLDIDEEVFLADSESEEELEPLFIPEVPNRILWMQSLPDDIIWLSMGGFDAGYIYEYKIDQKSEAPYYYKMVDDADDTEISSYVYNYNKKYLILAMENGVMRVNKINNNDFHDLSDYWTLSMHDNQNGFVPNLCFSYDEKYFFSCGYDGNVFSYTFHPEDNDYIPRSRYYKISSRSLFPESVYDEANYDKLSLEQASLKKEQDRIDKLAAKNREVYREKLKRLRQRFFQMLRRNQKLLPSQQIPMEELEVDPRVTNHIDAILEEELNLVKRKLAFDVQKSELRMKKLKKYYIDSLVFIPVIVHGLKINLGVKMSRQTKVAAVQNETLRIVDQKILEEDLKSRPVERPAPPSKVIVAKKPKEPGLEYFLVSLSPVILESPKRNNLTRLLQKYRMRKLKWEKRDEEWEEFLAKKPVPGVNHPDDDAALAKAKVTIGDYKLKTDPSYKAPPHLRESTVRKYKELLLSRLKQSTIRYNFNKQVYDLREEKIKLKTELEEMRMKLLQIHQEIPQNARIEPPTVRESPSSEFPEQNFEINVKFEIEKDDFEEVKSMRVVVDGPRNFDEQEKETLPKHTKKCDHKDPGDFANLDFETLCNLSKNEKRDTVWEADLKSRRLERKLFEQNKIINLMNVKIAKFDKRVEELNSERFTVEVKAKLMDIFMVTLHQELNILKEFEALETSLQAKVNAKMSDVLDMRDVIDEISAKIVHCNSEIEKAQETIKTMAVQFANSIQDNKFGDFLKKVFKKKYKPPKIHKDNESSSDESSSSSSTETDEEEDAKSIDSRDFAIIKQDLNVCPKGCDQNVYDMTVQRRTQRHKQEMLIKEQQKAIEFLKKDLEIQNKRVKVIEKDLKMCQDELEKYQRQKQEKMNGVRCTVILYLHQLQHLTPENKASNIMDTLVFSKTKFSELYQRVEELQNETFHEKKRLELNIKHYIRMKTDCDFMRKRIRYFQEVITDHMKIKFGKVVDINEIEEAMLKRTFGKDDLHDLEEVLLKKIIHDLRLSSMDIKGMYIDDLRYWKQKIVSTQKELTYVLRHSTSQQELLTFLTKEKSELTKTLISQEKKMLHIFGVEDILKKYSEEIAMLEKIVQDQNHQLQELRDEIKLLRTKGMVLKPKQLKPEVVVTEEPAEEEEATKAWEHLDLGLDDEEEEKKKPFSTEIVIPTTLHDKAQEVAAELIQEMLDALNIQLTKKSNDNFVREILNSVMRGATASEIVEEMQRNLPLEPEGDQWGILETTAEQLYVVGEPEVTEDDQNKVSKEVIDEIIQETLQMEEEAESVIASLIMKLVNQLSIDFLHKKATLEYLVSRLKDSHLNVPLNQEHILEMLENEEAKAILSKLIQIAFNQS